MTPFLLQKIGLYTLALGLVLTIFAGRPDEPPRRAPGPAATPLIVDEAPKSSPAEAVEPLFVPTPLVAPGSTSADPFAEALMTAAAAGAPDEAVRAALGDGGVDALRAALDLPTVGRTTPSARDAIVFALLAEDGSPAAQELLKTHALDPNRGSPAAAAAWLDAAASADDVLPLLRSRDAELKGAALAALVGKDLSPAAVDALTPRLTAGRVDRRLTAARAFAADSSPAAAEKKLAALMQAARQSAGGADAGTIDPESGLTLGDLTFAAFVEAARTMPGGPEAAAARRGARSGFLTIVLLQDGDEASVEEGQDLLKRARGFKRYLALSAMAPHLTLEDAPLLIQLAGDDWSVTPSSGTRFPTSELANDLLMNVE